jgi:sec-independent protein translocase protein TatA
VLGLDNPLHIAFLFAVLLLVFGAKRLPEMGRSLGAGLRGFKESIGGEPHRAQVEELNPASRVVPAPAHDPLPERSPLPPAA